MILPNRRWLICCIAAAACLAFGGGDARAGFSLTLTVGSNSFTVNDNDSNDSSSTAGLIVLNNFQFQGFSITTQTGRTNSPGSSTGRLTTDTFEVSYGGSGTGILTLAFFSDGFTAPGGAGSWMNVATRVTQDFGDDYDGDLSFFARLDGVNTTVLDAPNQGQTVTANDLRQRGATYTLESILTVTLASGRTTGGETSVIATVVPGPGASVLAASALPLLGAWGLYRRRKASA